MMKCERCRVLVCQSCFLCRKKSPFRHLPQVNVPSVHLYTQISPGDTLVCIAFPPIVTSSRLPVSSSGAHWLTASHQRWWWLRQRPPRPHLPRARTRNSPTRNTAPPSQSSFTL